MNYYTIRWVNQDGVADSEHIACEDFDDAIKRVKMKAALCNGTPKDIEDFGPITIMETAEQKYIGTSL